MGQLITSARHQCVWNWCYRHAHDAYVQLYCMLVSYVMLANYCRGAILEFSAYLSARIAPERSRSSTEMRLLRFVRRPKARAAVAAPAQPAPRTSRRRALRKWLAPRVFVLAAAVAPVIPRLPHDTTPVVVMHATAPHAPKQRSPRVR